MEEGSTAGEWYKDGCMVLELHRVAWDPLRICARISPYKASMLRR